jgi:hypothetical protein
MIQYEQPVLQSLIIVLIVSLFKIIESQKAYFSFENLKKLINPIQFYLEDDDGGNFQIK